jgi:hypothetical protein
MKTILSLHARPKLVLPVESLIRGTVFTTFAKSIANVLTVAAHL